MHIVTFSALADFPSLLEAHLHAFPAPPGGDGRADDELSVPLHTLVANILSFEIDVFHANLSLALQADHPVLSFAGPQSSPSDAEAEAEAEAETETETDSRTLPELTDLFQTARKRTLSILGDLTDAQWARAGQLDGTETTVIGLVHHLSAHDWDQLADLQRHLAACSAA